MDEIRENEVNVWFKGKLLLRIRFIMKILGLLFKKETSFIVFILWLENNKINE